MSREKDGYQIALDRTVFFPEGGGQYADPGYLDEVEVTDVHERDGVIWHYTKEPIPEGKEVEGRICGRCALSGCSSIRESISCPGWSTRCSDYDNVGFHLGEDYCTMDLTAPLQKSS